MDIIKWDPVRDLVTLQDTINRLFDDRFFGRKKEGDVAQGFWTPPVDIIEDDDKFLVRTELPGMKLEDIDIELEGNTLTIKGERKIEHEEKKEGFVRCERSYGSFRRSFTVGVPIKSDKIEAVYKDGMLEITLPKAQEARPKKVEIKAKAD
jgi:HSP20 family protein